MNKNSQIILDLKNIDKSYGETKVLENQPEGIIKAILGPAFTVKDAESFESLFKILDHPKFLYKNKKKNIIKSFIEVISKSKGLVVPDEMEEFI